MIDFHTHILPGIDDGSRDVTETEGLLREEVRQGAKRIVATPHFYADRISVEEFLKRRARSIDRLQAHLAELIERGEARGPEVGGAGQGTSGEARGPEVGGAGQGASGEARGPEVGGAGQGASGEARGPEVGGAGQGASGEASGEEAIAARKAGGVGANAFQIPELQYGGADANAFLIPQLQYGAEVYFFPGMGKAEKLPQLCVQGTNLLLLEMPFMQWTDDVLREVKDILQKQKLRVVLAHVERYPDFQKNRRVYEQVLALPVTIQLNGGSFLKGRSRRKFCLNLLNEKENIILGSDTHNLTSRPPNLEEARSLIEGKFGAERLKQIDRLTEQILNQTAGK